MHGLYSTIGHSQIILRWSLNQHLQIASVPKLAVATVLTVAAVLHLGDLDLIILLNHADNWHTA